MNKSPDAFRTISEVADWLGVPAHVLRFWESRFTQVKPVKRAGGRRYYRPADMQLLGGIRKLLHDDGLTIKGVQKMLREQGIAEVSALSNPLDEPIQTETDIADSAPDPAAIDTAEPAGELPSFRRGSAAESTPPQPVASPDNEAIAAGRASERADPVREPSVPQDSAPAPFSADASLTAANAESAAEPDTEQKPEPAATSPGQLPSFLKPAGDDTPSVGTAQETPSADAPEPQPTTSAPSNVAPTMPAAKRNLPDLPDHESALPYAPGILAILAGIDRVPPQTHEALRPVMDDLKACLSRIGGTDLA